MITILKLAGFGALLSAGLASGFSADAVRSTAPTSNAKLYTDRLISVDAGARVILASIEPSQLAPLGNPAGKGDRLRSGLARSGLATDAALTRELRLPTGSVLLRTPVGSEADH